MVDAMQNVPIAFGYLNIHNRQRFIGIALKEYIIWLNEWHNLLYCWLPQVGAFWFKAYRINALIGALTSVMHQIKFEQMLPVSLILFETFRSSLT